jgi:hypothetical protein
MKTFEPLKKHKLTILVGLLLLVLGLSTGAGVMSLRAKAPAAEPTQSVTSMPSPSSTPSLAGDPSKMDISSSAVESYPELPMSPDNPTLPAGSLDPVSDPAFPAATNQLELDFFKKAKASCGAFNSKGAKFYHFDGSYELWAKGDDGFMKANFFDAKGAFTGTLPEIGYLPSVCDPSSVNEQRLLGNKLFASNFWLESFDGLEYIWHSHRGGPSVSSVSVYFAQGLIRSTLEADRDTIWIRYGLNALEKKSALKTY